MIVDIAHKFAGMHNIKIMANQITTLTDARYFAAQMVDYLVFAPQKIDNRSLVRWQEIKDWVVGPQWIFNTIPFSQDEIINFLPQIEVDGIFISISHINRIRFSGKRFLVLTQEDLKSLPQNMESNMDLIIFGHMDILNYQTLKKSIKNPVWIEMDSIEHWNEISQILDGQDGIMVAGKEEEKIGYKSYETLDLFFEALESQSA